MSAFIEPPDEARILAAELEGEMKRAGLERWTLNGCADYQLVRELRAELADWKLACSRITTERDKYQEMEQVAITFKEQAQEQVKRLEAEASSDTTRMDFLDSIGVPWKDGPKDGKRLLLVALPYKPLPGQIAPTTIREAIDYILDCPESVERALDGKGIDLLSGKRSELTSDQFADVQRLNRMRRAIEWLLTFHPESPETGAELPKEAWAPDYREAVEYAQEALK